MARQIILLEKGLAQLETQKVSVLIPCYNRAAHIGKVIEAVQAQTHPADEIIVVDDASTDESREVVGRFPVRLICHETNQGPALARNTALQAASGDILLYIDADAYAEDNLIAVLLAAYRGADASTGGIGGRGIECRLESLYDRWRNYHARQDFGPRARQDVPYLYGLCASFRRKALVEVGGFDPFFPVNAGEDLDLGYRLKRAGYRLDYTPDAVVYHQHSDTHDSLKRVQYRWYYWSYLAKQRTGFHPWTLYAGTLRRLLVDTLSDLVLRRDLKLARLDLEIFAIKLRALGHAARSLKPAC